MKIEILNELIKEDRYLVLMAYEDDYNCKRNYVLKDIIVVNEHNLFKFNFYDLNGNHIKTWGVNSFNPDDLEITVYVKCKIKEPEELSFDVEQIKEDAYVSGVLNGK